MPAAFRMFEQLQAAGAAVDVVTGTTLMSASLRQKRPELSMAMLAEIRAAGLPLDTIVYKNAFLALGRLGDWQQALKVWRPSPRLRPLAPARHGPRLEYRAMLKPTAALRALPLRVVRTTSGNCPTGHSHTSSALVSPPTRSAAAHDSCTRRCATTGSWPPHPR